MRVQPKQLPPEIAAVMGEINAENKWLQRACCADTYQPAPLRPQAEAYTMQTLISGGSSPPAPPPPPACQGGYQMEKPTAFAILIMAMCQAFNGG